MSQENKAAGREHIPDFPSPPPTGVNWLLVIAIDEYDPVIGRLNNCVKDVRAFIDVVTQRYHFDSNRIIPLFNADATGEAIEAAFRKLLREVKTEDNLVIYYSGHGDYDDDIDLGYWIPADAKNRRQGLHNDLITRFLNRIPSRHTLLLCDSCFSGSLLLEEPTKNIGQRYYSQPSRWAITSGARELVSDGKEHSPFAKALLRVLQHTNGDVDILTLGGAIMEEVAANERQKPLFAPLRVSGHQGGMFVFFQKQNEAQEWTATEAADTAAAYHAFWQKYPDHPNAEEALWRYACKQNEVNAFQLYRNTFFGGQYFEAALDKIDDLVFEQAKNKGIDQLRDYLKRFGYNANHAAEAHQRIDDLLNGIRVKTPAQEQSAVSNKQTFGTFTDERDGQTYKTVELNGLVWMAENFNFEVPENSWFYKDDLMLGRKYGRLYSFLGAKEACPQGWRLPSDEEWKELILNYGGYYDNIISEPIGDKHKEAYFKLREQLNIENLGGYKGSDTSFGNLNDVGSFWSSTMFEAGHYINFNFVKNPEAIYRTKSLKFTALSVRYVRDPKLDIDSMNLFDRAAKYILPKEEIITDPPRGSFEPEMVFVQGGTFKMGNYRKSEKPIHEVILQDFYIGKYPVTFAEYDAFCEATKKEKPDDYGWCRDQRPVINITWHDARNYCEWLSKQTGKNYRLPSEAEWEYTARGGQNFLLLKNSWEDRYAGSHNLNEVGWYNNNSNRRTHPVGQKKANKLGIYDMSGNVLEWCADVWHENYKNAPTDGSAWTTDGEQTKRVLRGGACTLQSYDCQVFSRLGGVANRRNFNIGFRLAGY